jgi:16S rRNA (guanine527-N7)-methyltransferase
LTAASAIGDARPALGATLAAAAEQLGLPLSALQSSRLLDFVDLLGRWNRTYNLTAVRDPSAMLTQHVVDCLAVVPALRREHRGGRVLDVGSGGGLPGVVWAVMEAGMDITCVDSVGKKAAFLQQAAAALGLRNLHSEHARVETLAGGHFDLIASRAFAALPDFVALTSSLLAGAGVWLAMKGKVPTSEIAALGPAIDVFHVEQIQVPGLSADRCLVWMQKTETARIIDYKKSERSQSEQVSGADR